MCDSKRNGPAGRGSNRQQYKIIQPRSAIQAGRASLPAYAQQVLNALDVEVGRLVRESQQVRRELATMQRQAHNAGLRPPVPEFLAPVPYYAN